MQVEEATVIRVTIGINYEMRGNPHHPDELIESVNAYLQAPMIPSDPMSSNPRWTLVEQYRDIVVSGVEPEE